MPVGSSINMKQWITAVDAGAWMNDYIPQKIINVMTKLNHIS